jgi:hypothetical protein
MEAHAGTISIGTGKATRHRRHLLAELRQVIRRKRLDRAQRAYSLRVSGARPPFVPGSEHTHMLRQRGF